jgi:hypothetical protein
LKRLSLTYCTNVHPLGDLASWHDIIGRFGAEIRSNLGWTTLPMGLWFPATLAAELDKDPATLLPKINVLFQKYGLSAFTANGFPYGNFHDKVVKTKVYQPDWTEVKRLEYTLACARILAAILPKDSEGSLSTLPLGWRIGWTAEHSRQAVHNLLAYVQYARALADREGTCIRLAIEPEPGCALETTDQVVEFWNASLRPEAERAGISTEDLNRFCGLCYDTCHQAVQFENPIEALNTYREHGIPIAKMQLSSALVFSPDASGQSQALRAQFVEDRFLHQTRILTPDGLLHFDDLPQALSEASKNQDLWSYPWRVHFHIPIDAAGMLGASSITTTRDDMLLAFSHAVKHDLCSHFEVETYTWNVLPESHRPKNDGELARSIAGELRFITEHLPAGVMVNGIVWEGNSDG